MVLFVAALLVLFLRRPTTLTVAEFWADDGPIFNHALERGVAMLLEQWGGSLVLVQRAVVLSETWLPPQMAPVWGNVAALTMTALVAACIAIRLPLDPARRLAMAAGFVLLPTSSDVIGSMSHIQWVLGALLIAYPFAVRQRAWELVPLGAAALTGPLALFALPLYVGRWWRDRATRRALVGVGACALVQFAVILTSGRMYVPPDLALVPQTLIERTTHLPLVAGVVLFAMAVASTRRLPRSIALAGWGIALALPLAGMLHATEPTAAFLVDGAGSRYFWLTPGIIGAMVIAAPPGWTRAATLALLALLFAREAILPAHPVAGWAESSACIGGPVACVVRVEPTTGWGDNWAVRWTP